MLNKVNTHKKTLHKKCLKFKELDRFFGKFFHNLLVKRSIKETSIKELAKVADSKNHSVLKKFPSFF